ncbi:MAG TPA: hypothetical protein VFX48_01205 [Saprospiraceae bacterium]|nr:hypothetical protein [Saprospiraceae bacterium]
MNENLHHMDDPKPEFPIHRKSGSGYRLPEDYFDRLSDRIMDRVEQNALPEILKTSPFRAPDAYFELLEDRIINGLPTRSKPLVVRSIFRSSWIYAVAACALVLLSWFGLNLYNGSPNEDFLADTTEEELLEYVSAYASDFDETALALVLQEDELNSFEIPEEMDDETSELLIELYQ